MTEPSQEWINDCLRWRGVVLTGVQAHWCPEWDFLPIDETTREIESCICNLDEESDDAKPG